MTKTTHGLSFIALTIALTLGLAGCGREKPAEHLPRVLVREVATTDYAARPSVVGDIQARVEAQQAFRVGGKIIERSADVGDAVKAGQVLARLDPKDLQTQVENARAAVVAEEARLRLAQVGFQRQGQLLPKGYTSRSEYDRAQAELRSAQSSLEAARAQLASARDQLSYTELKASADGVITQRSGEVGQVVQATKPIFTLARDGERDAVFNVYESLFQGAQSDQPVTVHLLSDPKVQVQGRVREVTPTVDTRSGTLKVKVGLDQVPAAMGLGAVVGAELAQAAEPRALLPWSALFKQGKSPAVWVLDDQDRAQLKPVGQVSFARERVMIGEGLQAGERVIVAGGQLLHPNQKVEVARPEQVAEPVDSSAQAEPRTQTHSTSPQATEAQP
ncbi:efflux RND transporter periplasmic adaptor subunit [Pseudomonas sp. CAN2814]|uniref:efflux RND transporter periplasmic adaptor subunit n=1 Tax=Pseudomonas sp. CAN1 TaxID=3046726 RepID=UPI0026477C5E|nr:efflux RND transporter periplasmic adaptor subunit [Pseudomonas sp. CAN1]MDN6860945.1 efflux RND transporter periplasmic adaptor subunit [Pseudomonas sp. CAN1]